MTSSELDALLKSISIKREGDRLLISGSAFVDGKLDGFMVYRKIPAEQPPKVPPYKMFWFEELSDYDMKGKTK